MYGIEIKNFFCTPKGVLIFTPERMVFISYPGFHINEVYGINEHTYEKKVIVSGQFDKVKSLEDGKEYIIDVVFNTVEIREPETQNLVLTIDGLRY